MQTLIKKLPKSLIEITGEVPIEKFEGKRARAIKNLAQSVEIDGFRKGMVPESVLVKKLGSMAILEEMAHLTLNETYPEIVTSHELDVIGNPEITITKIAEGSPLGFKMVSAIMPDIELPNYKKIAGEAEKIEAAEVTDKEVDETIENIRKNRARDEKKEPQLHELNDEFAKSLGKFESLADLKTKLKKNIKIDKELRAKEKKRMAIIEKIISEIKTEIPDILINAETEKLIARMRNDIERMGLKFDDYLKNLKKSEGDFKKEWRGEGEKRAKIELALAKIAKIENIKPKDEEVEKEVKHVIEHYKETKETLVRDYVTSLLTNEKVFKFLEGQR